MKIRIDCPKIYDFLSGASVEQALANKLVEGEEWKKSSLIVSPRSYRNEAPLARPFRSATLYMSKIGEIYQAQIALRTPIGETIEWSKVNEHIGRELDNFSNWAGLDTKGLTGYIIAKEREAILSVNFRESCPTYNLSIGKDGARTLAFQTLEELTSEVSALEKVASTIVNAGINAIKDETGSSNPDITIFL